ncbi:PDDEXK nuclease domain-containing protein [uncultured Oscillibacter sp.]|uniref:PDDEXK nuclease domain-containing protein n=1 Tax=uncultured Oscillibacter sp. TaxID=876091 RepID=UPI003453C8A7
MKKEMKIVPTPRIAERDRKEAAGEKYKRTVKPAWAIVTVQGILDNDFYIGTLWQGKYTRKKIDGKEVKRDELDELFADLKASGKQNDVDGQYFYIDLVFCNYILKCFVRIDLKTGNLTHQDIGQMQMYVNYDTRYQMNGGGIIHRQDCSCALRRAIPWCN